MPRPWGFGKPVAEAYAGIDVRRLTRDGMFRTGRSVGLTWGFGGRTTETAAIETDGESVTVHFVDGSNPVRTEKVWLTHATPGYGGRRAWFRCPLCARRCAILYIAGRLACRVCLGLAYRSERGTKQDRLNRKARKLLDRVGRAAISYEGFPPKPPGMWWRTYIRLADQWAEIERRRIAAFLPMLARLHERVTGRPLSVGND